MDGEQSKYPKLVSLGAQSLAVSWGCYCSPFTFTIWLNFTLGKKNQNINSLALFVSLLTGKCLLNIPPLISLDNILRIQALKRKLFVRASTSSFGFLRWIRINSGKVNSIPLSKSFLCGALACALASVADAKTASLNVAFTTVTDLTIIEMPGFNFGNTVYITATGSCTLNATTPLASMMQSNEAILMEGKHLEP